MSAYVLLRFLHILLAAIVIGATVSYAVWIGLAERVPEHLAFTIRAVRRSDRLVAIPAYLLLLVSGLVLAGAGRFPLDRPWLLWGTVLYVVTLVVGFALFGPTVRRELAALERGGPADPEYRRRRRDAWLYTAFTIAMLVAILALMVAKPF